MTAYIIVLSILFIFAFISIRRPEYLKTLSYLSTFLLILFAGLRFQTGYDWDAYEANYNAMVTFKGLLCKGLPSLPVKSEPLFLILNIFFKSLNFSTAAFFYVIAAMNLLLIHFVISKITKEVVLTWIPYFGFAFLIAQMTIVRQGIASSLVLFALLLASNGRTIWAFVFQLFAIGFHMSTAIFTPLLFLKCIRPDKILVILFLTFGIALTALGISVHSYVFKIIFEAAPQWFDKVPYYMNAVQSPLSFGSAGLILFHIAILTLLYKLSDTNEKKSHKINLTIWLTLLVLGGHLYAHGFPTIWNRIMLVSLPFQIAGLFSLSFFQKVSRSKYRIIAVALYGLSLTAMIYSLSKPQALPFVPYSSIIDPLFGMEQVDGYARLRKMRQLYGTQPNRKNEIIDPNSFDELTPPTEPERKHFEPALKNFFDYYCDTQTN